MVELTPNITKLCKQVKRELVIAGVKPETKAFKDILAWLEKMSKDEAPSGSQQGLTRVHALLRSLRVTHDQEVKYVQRNTDLNYTLSEIEALWTHVAEVDCARAIHAL